MKFIFVSTLFFFSSCLGRYNGPYKVGKCVEEQDKRYAKGSRSPSSVYKVHSARSREFIVSVWYNKSWLYQGKKAGYYFSEGRNFAYELVDCPDGTGSKMRGIEERVNKINI